MELTMCKRLVAALGLAFSVVAQAQVEPDTAEMLMDKSGLTAQMAGIAARMRAEARQHLAQAGVTRGSAESDRVSRLIDDSFEVSRLQRVSREYLTRHLDSRHVPELVQWFDAPLAQTISQLEAASSRDTTDPQQAQQEGVALLKAMPAPRRALVERLFTVTHAAEFGADMIIGSSTAVVRAMARAMPGAQPDQIAEIQRRIEAQRAQLLEVLVPVYQAAMARIYAPLPTEDLARYVAFAGTDAGQHLNSTSARAATEALIEASAEFARRLPAPKASASAPG
jgi:hypothetical protein